MNAAASAPLMVQVRFPEVILPISMAVNDTVGDLAQHLETTYPHMFLPSTFRLSAPYPQVLCVFLLEVVGTTAREIPPATLLSSLPQGGVITAQAAFGSVPYAIFRTVQPEQVDPAESALNQSSFTQKSPFFCAAFGPDEFDPSSNVVKLGLDTTTMKNPTVYGISTFALSSEMSPHNGQPYTWGLRDPIQPADPPETRYMLISSLDPPASPNDLFGSLHSGNFFVTNPAGLFYIPKSGLLQSLVVSKKVTKKRDGYFCFKLPSNTDLTPFGLAIVYDNDPQGHHTLIPVNVPTHVQIHPLYHNKKTYQFFYDSNLRRSAAAHFQLCCFKIVASASVLDDDVDPDDPLVRVHQLIFEYSSFLSFPEEKIELVLEEMRVRKWNPALLSFDTIKGLQDAWQELQEMDVLSLEDKMVCEKAVSILSEKNINFQIAVFRSPNPPADETKVIEMYTEVIKDNCRGLFGSETPSIFAEASIDCVLLLDDFESKERFQALLESSETCSFHVGPYEYVLQKEESKLSKVRYVEEDEETGHVVFDCEVYDSQGYSHVVRATSLCTIVGQPSLKHYVAVFRAANRQ